MVEIILNNKKNNDSISLESKINYTLNDFKDLLEIDIDKSVEFEYNLENKIKLLHDKNISEIIRIIWTNNLKKCIINNLDYEIEINKNNSQDNISIEDDNFEIIESINNDKEIDSFEEFPTKDKFNLNKTEENNNSSFEEFSNKGNYILDKIDNESNKLLEEKQNFDTIENELKNKSIEENIVSNKSIEENELKDISLEGNELENKSIEGNELENKSIEENIASNKSYNDSKNNKSIQNSIIKEETNLNKIDNNINNKSCEGDMTIISNKTYKETKNSNKSVKQPLYKEENNIEFMENDDINEENIINKTERSNNSLINAQNYDNNKNNLINNYSETQNNDNIQSNPQVENNNTSNISVNIEKDDPINNIEYLSNISDNFINESLIYDSDIILNDTQDILESLKMENKKFSFEVFDCSQKSKLLENKNIIKCQYCKVLIKNINYYLCKTCNYNVCFVCYEKFNNHNHKMNYIPRKDEINYYNQILLESENMIYRLSSILGYNICLSFKDIVNFRNLVKIYGEENFEKITYIFIKNKEKHIFEIQDEIELEI